MRAASPVALSTGGRSGHYFTAPQSCAIFAGPQEGEPLTEPVKEVPMRTIEQQSQVPIGDAGGVL